ncbi:MAG TPA: YceD family protein, partial [Elusimicrobiales bacterium]|nr:YceD family protein [Elusimicrobiales bacterium]
SVRAEIALTQDIKEVCKTDCKGLCSKCGADLNKTKCNCSKHSPVAFSVLKDKLSKAKKSFGEKRK